MSRKYHCATQHDTDHGVVHIRALCGSADSASWDFAPEFIAHNEGFEKKTKKCEECRDHPDLPLLLLGRLP